MEFNIAGSIEIELETGSAKDNDDGVPCGTSGDAAQDAIL